LSINSFEFEHLERERERERKRERTVLKIIRYIRGKIFYLESLGIIFHAIISSFIEAERERENERERERG